MADHNPLQCIGWDRNCPRRADTLPPALCEHDGCTWESDATTIDAQTSAYINHHNHRHQGDS